MLRIEPVIHPIDGEVIDTLWELFPDGDAGIFIFHSQGITIDFKRVGDEYFYEMKFGDERVAIAKQPVGQKITAHLDSRYYTFIHGSATDVRRINV